MAKITLKEKLELFKNKGFTYDYMTGIICNNNGRQIIKPQKDGYIGISYYENKITYSIRAHQLAWYLYYNEIPIGIDHIDRNRSNNKINNLRLLTQQKNTFNRNCKGWYFDKRNLYYTSICLDGKSKFLGRFKTEKEAEQAYLDAKKIYHII